MSTLTDAQARVALVEAGRRLVELGLVARSWGNVSVRIDARTMMVTPSGIPWADLRGEMLSLVDLESGEWTGSWKPSGERKVHREIYRRRPEVDAVIHTHQSAASACAAVRRPVSTPQGLIPCAPYALPGTKRLTEATVAALGSGSTVLMANHGVFAVGGDLDAAFGYAAALERACADYLARQTQGLPARADLAWDASWLRPASWPHGQAFVSAAPFTLAWASSGRSLPAVLDDLAQLAGPRVACIAGLPRKQPRNDVVLVRGQGAFVCGPDAEALAMVVEKAARAVLAGAGLGGVHPFPAWEASLMRWVYRNSYAKQAKRSAGA